MSGPKPKPFECPEPVFWYLVGLIATDGCLSSDGRHVILAAKDQRYLRAIKAAAGLSCQVTATVGGYGHRGHRLQIGSRTLYDWLLGIGLTPRKSLTLPPLQIPDARFHDFLRGVIDGDGNIRRWIHPTNGREQWTVRIVGCSRPFLSRLQNTIKRSWHLKGALHAEGRTSENRHTKYTLKFGKLAAKSMLAECYYPGALALDQKHRLAQACISATVGWRKSQTVVDAARWSKWQYVHVYPTGPQHTGANSSPNPTGRLLGGRKFSLRAGVAQLERRGRLKTFCPARDMWVRLPLPASVVSDRRAVSSAG